MSKREFYTDVDVKESNVSIKKTSGIASLSIDSDDNEASVIFRAGNPENLWAIGADDFTDQFVITSTNGLSGSQEFNINTANNTVNVQTKRIINVVDPVNPQDAATKFYVDSLVGGGTSNAYTVWQIWAEESGALANGANEWSYGNGNTGLAIGIPVLIDCELFASSFNTSSFGTSVSIDILINQVVAQTVTFSANNTVENFTPIALTAGDLLNFRTNTVNGAFPNGRVSAGLRVKASGMPDILYTPNGQEAITTDDLLKEVTLEGYGTGAITGTPAFGIAVDSSGKIIERNINTVEVGYAAISGLGVVSATFANIPGLTTTVNLQDVGTVNGSFSYSAVRSGGTNANAQFRVVIGGNNGTIYLDTLSTFSDVGTVNHFVESLPAGAYTVTVQAAVDNGITINAGQLEANAIED